MVILVIFRLSPAATHWNPAVEHEKSNFDWKILGLSFWKQKPRESLWNLWSNQTCLSFIRAFLKILWQFHHFDMMVLGLNWGFGRGCATFTILRKIKKTIWDQIWPTLDVVRAIGAIFRRIWALFFRRKCGSENKKKILKNSNGWNIWNFQILTSDSESSDQGWYNKVKTLKISNAN